MAPSTYDYATIIILDIGKNVGEDKDFFTKAKECAARIIERNIMIQMKNLVGIIYMGSSTNNELAAQCNKFKHLNLAMELRTPTWQMIRDLPEKATEHESDWFEALIVAAHQYKEGTIGCKINSKKIVLITNFQAAANVKTYFEQVVSGFQEDNFEVFVIGPDLETESVKSIDYVRQLITETNGDTATFEEAMGSWLFHKKKASKVVPQYFALSIGPNIQIPVSIYIRIKDEPVVKSWQKAIKDPVTLSASTSEGIKTDRKIITEQQMEIEQVNTVEGYMYGQRIIPFSADDKAMLYKSGPRSLSLYGFTDSKNIQWQRLQGDCLYYVSGRKNDSKSQYTINCLVQCLQELQMVGIVRKVHCKDSEPKMFALLPVVDNSNNICLSMIGICYKESIKNMAFPSTELKKYEVKQEQVDAFKKLINSMNLMKAYDDSFTDPEAFPFAETVSPSIQYILDCISFRAMNPGKPLPKPREEIMTLFKVPPLLQEQSADIVEKLKNLFPLRKVEKKTRKKMDAVPDQKAQDDTKQDIQMPKVNLPLKDDSVKVIGSVNPIKDLQALISKGKTLTELAPDLGEVIENLVYTNFTGDYSKVIQTMASFREESIKTDPALYNNWLQKFKSDLSNRRRDGFIYVINENNINFILNTENNLSTYTLENTESQVYDNDTIPNSTELSIQSDVNDLFDDM